MLTFNTKISKKEIIEVQSEKGNYIGTIKYFQHIESWGLNDLHIAQLLNENECLDLHNKLKELNNANL